LRWKNESASGHLVLDARSPTGGVWMLGLDLGARAGLWQAVMENLRYLI
jgi:hypothetical protein